jgi:hypothetical protein
MFLKGSVHDKESCLLLLKTDIQANPSNYYFGALTKCTRSERPSNVSTPRNVHPTQHPRVHYIHCDN